MGVADIALSVNIWDCSLSDVLSSSVGLLKPASKAIDAALKEWVRIREWILLGASLFSVPATG